MHPRLPTLEPAQSLPITYQMALLEHVALPGRATLRQASALGRAAMDSGLGIPGLISLHHLALAEGAAADGHPVVRVRFAPALDSFFMEALLPFGVAECG